METMIDPVELDLLWQTFAALPFELKEMFALLVGIAVGAFFVLLIFGSRAALDNWRDRHR